MNTKDYAAALGVMKVPEFTWDFKDNLTFQVAAAVTAATITAGDFLLQTSATLSALWPSGPGHFYLNGRLYTYASISGADFVDCNGVFGSQATVVGISEGEIGWQGAPDTLGNMLLQLASAGLVYRAADQTGLNVTIAPLLWRNGMTYIAYAGATLALTDTATNYIYAWNNAGTITVEARTDSFAAGEAARGTILPLATIVCAAGTWGSGNYSDNRLGLLAALSAAGVPLPDPDATGFLFRDHTAGETYVYEFDNGEGIILALSGAEGGAAVWSTSPDVPHRNASSYASTDDVTNSIIPATLLDLTELGTWTIPTAQFQPGSAWRFRAQGLLTSDPLASSDTVRLRFLVGAALLIDTSGNIALSGPNTFGWSMDVLVVCNSIGASGAFEVFGDLKYGGNGAALTAHLQYGATGGYDSTGTIDTTADRLVDLTAGWSAARAGNSIKVRHARLERVA